MDKNTGYIYCITNISNGKKYIGATTRTVEKRFKQHISDSKCDRNNGCTCLKNAMQEFGENNFIVETLIICNLEKLDFYENNFINLYNTIYPNGYNLKTGGNLGSKHCNETKIKIGESQIGKTISDETRCLISITSKYRNIDEKNKNKIKESLKKLGLEELPMYIVYSIDKRFNRNIDVIQVRVPKTKTKKFASKNISLENKIILAIEYKNSLTKELKV